MTTRLTDDEVLALASLAGRAWPSVLPTVDVASPDDTALAIRRGVRSLGVRHLVLAPVDDAPSGTFHEDLQPLADAVGAGPGRRVVVLQQVQAVPPHVASGVVVVAFDDDTTRQTFLDVVSPAGIHDVTPMPTHDAHAAITETLRTVFRDGVSTGGTETALAVLLTVLTDVGPTAALVRRGVCETGHFDVLSGTPTFVAARSEATVDGVLATLDA